MGGFERGWRVIAVLGAWSLLGCATGSEPDTGSAAFDGGPGQGDAQTSTTTFNLPENTTAAPEDDGDEDPGVPPADSDADSGVGGDCSDDTDCVIAPGSCLETQGHCELGVCEHGAADPGVDCDDGDPCTEADACDGEGVCLGVELQCTAPNAQGGQCVDGTCSGVECSTGWADCNADMSDGCELELGTEANCGGCGDVCSAGANASASCSAGACQYQCQSPWDNCDGDWANGCEIPVGVPHQCDAGGLNPAGGCWTAYCGNSGSASATNFGTFHCIDCSTCRSPAAGQCQWCDHASGTFFPQDTCGCGGFEDLACG